MEPAAEGAFTSPCALLWDEHTLKVGYAAGDAGGLCVATVTLPALE